MIFSKPQFMV